MRGGSWSELGDGSELEQAGVRGASWSELGDGSELEQAGVRGASWSKLGVSWSEESKLEQSAASWSEGSEQE